MSSALSSPAALRNRDPILDVLRGQLGAGPGRVLEIASGTGEHVSHFAAALPGFDFQPSDIDPQRRASIDALAEGLANVRPAIALDTTADWTAGLPVGFDAVVCINMIHIAPWPACLGLLRGSAVVLRPGGLLLLYGPYRVNGEHTAPSNAAFDADLRRRDPSWGVRDIESVTAAAGGHYGLAGPDIVAMPANNLCVLFRTASTTA